MKIYFSASYKEKEHFKDIYERIVKHFQIKKHEVYETVLAEYKPSLTDVSSKNVKNWFSEWSNYVRQCDFAVIEGSYPSTIQIGFEIGMILLRGKPVVLLYKKEMDPVYINSSYTSRLIKSEYDETNLEETLDWCIEEVKALSNKRFTFFINSDIEHYLDKIAENNGTTKSEFIRNLIEKEMYKNINNLS